MQSFYITPTILKLTHELSRRLGFLDGLAPPLLSKEQKRDYTAALVHEGLSDPNTLSLRDVQLIQAGMNPEDLKRLDPSHVIEVKNAFKLYKKLHKIDPCDPKSLLEIYETLTRGIVSPHMTWRTIVSPEDTATSPTTEAHQQLMEIHNTLKHDEETPLLIKACLYPYEIRYINIFGPWNEAVGRIMHRLLLMRESALFEWVPFAYKQKVHVYEYTLKVSDDEGDGAALLAFYLRETFEGLLTFAPKLLDIDRSFKKRLKLAHGYFKENWFPKEEYIRLIRKISNLKPLQDLEMGVKEGIAEVHIKSHNLRRFRFKEG